jgi:hypothetical protein
MKRTKAKVRAGRKWLLVSEEAHAAAKARAAAEGMKLQALASRELMKACEQKGVA